MGKRSEYHGLDFCALLSLANSNVTVNQEKK